MNLDGIDVFVKVAQTGSFTAAAKQLGMPVTTASGKVAALEKRLGVTLIQRTTRKLNLTEAGEVFFRHSVKALDEVRLAEQELETEKSEPQGLLRITAVIDVGNTILVPLIRSYLKAYPKMRVELVLTNRIVDLVGDGVDLAVRVGTLKDSSLIATKFRDTVGGLWATPTYLKKRGAPSSVRDLKKHELIAYSGFQNLKLTNGKDRFEVENQGRFQADDMETLKLYAMYGDGIALIPNFICEQEARKGQLVRVLPQWEWTRFSLSFVYPAQRFVPPKVQSFIAWAKKERES